MLFSLRLRCEQKLWIIRSRANKQASNQSMTNTLNLSRTLLSSSKIKMKHSDQNELSCTIQFNKLTIKHWSKAT